MFKFRAKVQNLFDVRKGCVFFLCCCRVVGKKDTSYNLDL